jgi:hypothetical protein
MSVVVELIGEVAEKLDQQLSDSLLILTARHLRGTERSVRWKGKLLT